MNTTGNNVIQDIWRSFLSLPLWVKVWMMGILMPMNLASLLFLSDPWGYWVASLAILGMAPNGVIMIYDRGFTKLMAVPHVVPWSVLIVVIFVVWPPMTETYGLFYWALALTNLISLLFDIPDSVKWWKEFKDKP